ncbi:MAG: biotin--[acetyl-CoA-carboxylase] ligase [Bacillota bacterium]|nr:biotin--[acetyl-CoA-carboxylase] ligase [Bacillota bacterium]
MLDKKIYAILNRSRGKIISGGEISRELGVTRAAVWKEIRHLIAEGTEIESIHGRGYCLNSEDDTLSEEAIKAHLATNEIGRNIAILKTVDSTNNYAKAEAASGAPHGFTVISEEQTAGKGRLGRKFESPAKKGIYLSIVLRPNIPARDMGFYTISAAVAVSEAVEKISGLIPEIKWVNDVLLSGKKLCGILTEASVEGESHHLEYVVVGIGINVSTDKKDFSENVGDIAVSLSQEGLTKVNRCRLIAEILNQYEKLYSMFLFENNKKEVLDLYKKRLCVLGKEIDIISGNTKRQGKAVLLDEEGGLVVELPDGKRETLTYGEISIMNKE